MHLGSQLIALWLPTVNQLKCESSAQYVRACTQGMTPPRVQGAIPPYACTYALMRTRMHARTHSRIKAGTYVHHARLVTGLTRALLFPSSFSLSPQPPVLCYSASSALSFVRSFVRSLLPSFLLLLTQSGCPRARCDLSGSKLIVGRTQVYTQTHCRIA